jgi:endonuclease-8
MPEGDTIHRSAGALRPVLVGQRIVRLELPGHPSGIRPALGAVVEDVSARGKHLLIALSDGLVLHTHMGMQGSWHLYRPGERWRRPPHTARAIVETAGAVAVCFAAPTVELLDQAGLARHPVLSSRGPDLIVARPGPPDGVGTIDGAMEVADVTAVALERLRTLVDPHAEIGVVLLDQRVACGIGNVYKSEVCHAVGVHPFTAVGSLGDDVVRSLYRTASVLLTANLTTTRRTTVTDTGARGGGLAVYGRAGRPCRTCATPVRSARQGAHQRVTSWCPTCQPLTSTTEPPRTLTR